MDHPPRVGDVAHVAINADDPASSQAFYTAVLGWRFEPWGPPGFAHVLAPDGSRPGLIAAMQQRRTFADGTTAPVEMTVAVEDVARCCAAAREAGGRVLMEPAVIPGVGELAFLADPSGVPVGVMRFDPAT